MKPSPGDVVELEISALASGGGGEGIARMGEGGYVVFVAGAIPGDRVRALVHKRKRSYAHARMLEVLEQSPERIAPAAEHPGVPWQVIPYERQLEIKSAQVDEALRRIGRLDGFELAAIVPAVEQWRYRNKLEYSFGVLERAGTGAGEREQAGELVCGFHAPAGANAVLGLEDCLLASLEGNRARRAALHWCREQGLEAWERNGAHAARANGSEPAARGRDADARARYELERTAPAPDGRARLRNLVVRDGRRTGQLQVRIVTTEGSLDAGALADALHEQLGDSLSGVLWTRSRRLAETTAGGETELISGELRLPERVCELDLRISPEAFFQTNTEMAERVYGYAMQYAGLEGWERVYDLYSGIGTIALSLAPRAGELWGIELVEGAVADAIAGARRNEVTNARFFAGDVRAALPELVQRVGRPDVIVVDPPRAGVSKKVVRRVIEAAPRRVVYVSCNPTTLAPNAAELVHAGFELVRVQPVDMFPQTPHVECVALLERRRP
ncbi:MAG: 23S rRNA (uracil(1939)-C(5))-methyltransferase RlmD [Actinobacteria bacterium]|nr:MAG: 23S rRNA (uracil(1939)-C(5))-methyltransferase RlmD [Actinomycetota bacterium]